MLPFRYLVENYRLARTALARWPHDPTTPDSLLEQFRISSNAIYPYRDQDGHICLLRIAPAAQKREASIAGELAFVRHLRDHGYPALAFLPSRDGRLLEAFAFEGETYFATASRSVPGVRLDRLPLTEEIALAYGSALGTLHRESTRYTPTNAPWTYAQALEWMRATLSACGGAKQARHELEAVSTLLDALPKTPATYGVIHYDFELDNVFYAAETGTCHVIDFDDCMVHFFAMDIDQAVDSIREEAPPDQADALAARFLEGYRAIFPVTDALLQNRVFRRFAALYGYTRSLYAAHEMLPEEADWMRDLRARLLAGRKAYVASLG